MSKKASSSKAGGSPAPCPVGCEIGPQTPATRANRARDIRVEAAENERCRPLPSHNCNGDEARYQTDPVFRDRFIASFTKGLPITNNLGEVDPAAYCTLLRALKSGRPKESPPNNPPRDFESVPLGCIPDSCRKPINSRKLENPQSALAFDLEGADSHALSIPPAPRFDSEEEIGEIAENYWMALARDVPFTEYTSNPITNAAAADLSTYADFNGPKSAGSVTTGTLFRGFTPDDLIGPYVSQFLLIDVPYGAQVIPARIRSVLPGVDYMTAYDDWLSVQSGCDANQSACDRTPRYIRSGRDLGQYVHVDLTFNAFLNACLLLFSGRDPLRRCEAIPGLGVPFAEGLPYVNPSAPGAEEFATKSRNQIGMATFGPQHVKSLLLEAMSRALKAVWYQKWSVHRRLRPEAFAGRIHNHLVRGTPYPFNAAEFAKLQAAVLPRIAAHNANQNHNLRQISPGDRTTYLLPMAYAEGSPLHPAYGAGHATVAGASVTILKAFFPEDQLIVNPVVPTPDGDNLVPYTGPGNDQITVGGELNKLAANISLGRDIAGVHWRSDYTQSVLLGEEVAISILCDQRKTFNESYFFRFTRFDGTTVVIDHGRSSPPCPVCS